jgi:hypothetical protein
MDPLALETCQRCAVRWECRETALAEPLLHGTWGGLTEAARNKLRRTSA